MTDSGTYGRKSGLFLQLLPTHTPCYHWLLFLWVPRPCTGSYAGAGYLLATLDTSDTVTNYARWLDLDKAITRTTWSQDGAAFNRYGDDILRSEHH